MAVRIWQQAPLWHLHVLLAIVCLCLSLSQALPEQYNIYEHDGHWCYSCPMGHKVLEHCKAAFGHSTCEPCEPKYYMNETNSRQHCLPCTSSICPKLAVLVQNCTNTTNQKCQCMDGFYDDHGKQDSIDQNWMHCLPHKVCKSNEGVTFQGDHIHDRECRPCIFTPGPDQEFINQSIPSQPVCQSCSTCPGTCDLQQHAGQILVLCSISPSNLSTTPPTTATKPDKLTPQNAAPGDESSPLDGGLVALFFAFGLLLIFLVVCCMYMCYKQYKRKDSEIRCDSGDEEASVQFLPGNSAANDTASSMANGQVSTSTANGATLCSDDEDVGSSWSEDFIKNTVIPYVTDNIVHEWKTLIRALPGIDADCAKNLIERAEADEPHNIRERFTRALQEWMERCEDREINLTRGAILNVLKKVGQNHVRQYLMKLNSEEDAISER